MSRQILKDIINNFRVEDFTRFFRAKNNKFSHPNESLHYNDDNFKEGKKLEEIRFTDGNLIVCSFLVKKALSERSGKKAQYELGKKVLKESQADAGIFIFYDESGNFRFSLIYTNYLGKRRDWSTFRRFTYFVNKEFTNKTFLQRIGDGDFSNIEKIKDAFSVEMVTKEFYLHYRQLFEDLTKDLQKNHTFQHEASRNQIDTENFAKKLLGQIIFLYFIQKKGWLGVSQEKSWGTGDKNFLYHLFNEAEKLKKNFYDEYLEPLFYDTLNNPRRNSADPSYSSYFKSRIPFLNGGLFEPEYNWKSSLIYLDNKIFGRIFDVFDRYNFTVEEESPDDKEVAVDPEMLGKVFENLLPENLRKGKGAYYTPREIVYYMCRESLVNYLASNHSNISEEKIREYFEYSDALNKDITELNKIWRGESFTPGQWKELDELLKNIKVCDPACGSGAFLIGMLNEIVKLRIFLQLTPDSELFSKESSAIKELSEYQLKKETIQNCLYGVDIDPGAIEIAKLRLWLSLIVDYTLENVEPLPNLDYRLMTGDSLIEEFEGVKFYNSDKNLDIQISLLPQDAERKKKIKELKAKILEYFNLYDDEMKKQKRKEINDIKDWLVRSALEKRKHDLANQRKVEETKANMLDEKSRKKYLASWSDKVLAEVKLKEVLDNLHNPNKEKPFFIWKLEFIDVFADKKGFDVIIANPPYIDSESMIREGQENIREIIQRTYDFTKGNWDIYIAFLELAFKKINDIGILTFITPDKWISKSFGDELRKNTIKNIFLIVKAGRKVFESSKIDSIISFFSKKQSQKIKILEFKDKRFIAKREIDKKLLKEPFALDWLFSDYIDFLIRIDLISGKVSDLGNCENSCATSDAYKLEPLIKNLSGGFDKKSQLKIINTGTIGKYYSKWGKQGMKYLGHKYMNPIIQKEKFFSLFKNSYAKKSVQSKIILKGLNLLDACLDINGSTIPGKSTLIIISENINKLKLLLAIINSKLACFYLKEKFIASSYNQGISFTKEMINNLPVPKIAEKDQEFIIKIIDNILSIVSKSGYDFKNPPKKQKDLEEKIDHFIYELYGLTKKEIEIVDK